ncbi:hypothetical protein HK097_007420 [Rhizophlyctis rosea]|uniref:Uncharacterized protein n=1 Tax=Rhizophlyctis rosea TaxID=64517 RepID=A0AAD5X1M6_9FUNG|nr:hypothetical protein HK097_007420 [Rhizophlyctis rosea]
MEDYIHSHGPSPVPRSSTLVFCDLTIDDPVPLGKPKSAIKKAVDDIRSTLKHKPFIPLSHNYFKELYTSLHGHKPTYMRFYADCTYCCYGKDGIPTSTVMLPSIPAWISGLVKKYTEFTICQFSSSSSREKFLCYTEVALNPNKLPRIEGCTLTVDQLQTVLPDITPSPAVIHLSDLRNMLGILHGYNFTHSSLANALLRTPDIKIDTPDNSTYVFIGKDCKRHATIILLGDVTDLLQDFGAIPVPKIREWYHKTKYHHFPSHVLGIKRDSKALSGWLKEALGPANLSPYLTPDTLLHRTFASIHNQKDTNQSERIDFIVQPYPVHRTKVDALSQKRGIKDARQHGRYLRSRIRRLCPPGTGFHTDLFMDLYHFLYRETPYKGAFATTDESIQNYCPHIVDVKMEEWKKNKREEGSSSVLFREDKREDKVAGLDEGLVKYVEVDCGPAEVVRHATPETGKQVLKSPSKMSLLSCLRESMTEEEFDGLMAVWERRRQACRDKEQMQQKSKKRRTEEEERRESWDNETRLQVALFRRRHPGVRDDEDGYPVGYRASRMIDDDQGTGWHGRGCRCYGCRAWGEERVVDVEEQRFVDDFVRAGKRRMERIKMEEGLKEEEEEEKLTLEDLNALSGYGCDVEIGYGTEFLEGMGGEGCSRGLRSPDAESLDGGGEDELEGYEVREEQMDGMDVDDGLRLGPSRTPSASPLASAVARQISGPPLPIYLPLPASPQYFPATRSIFIPSATHPSPSSSQYTTTSAQPAPQSTSSQPATQFSFAIPAMPPHREPKMPPRSNHVKRPYQSSPHRESYTQPRKSHKRKYQEEPFIPFITLPKLDPSVTRGLVGDFARRLRKTGKADYRCELTEEQARAMGLDVEEGREKRKSMRVVQEEESEDEGGSGSGTWVQPEVDEDEVGEDEMEGYGVMMEDHGMVEEEAYGKGKCKAVVDSAEEDDEEEDVGRWLRNDRTRKRILSVDLESVVDEPVPELVPEVAPELVPEIMPELVPEPVPVPEVRKEGRPLRGLNGRRMMMAKVGDGSR